MSDTKQLNPRRFLTDQLAHLKRLAVKGGVPFDLSLDCLEEIWNKQSGRCAITGIAMKHSRHDLYSVRIDIVDPQKGFTKENIQLVCDGVKRIKKNMTNAEMIEFVNEIRQTLVIQQ